MAVSLTKGQKVDLNKVATDAGVSNLNKIRCGLGWDTNKYDGGHQFDLDVSVVLVDDTDKALPANDGFIYYNNLMASGVEHTGDNRTGDGEGDDETVYVTLSEIPTTAQKVKFIVTIYEANQRSQNFGQVSNAYIRLIDDASNTELIRYDLGEDFSIETGLEVGEIYRNGTSFKFNPIGSGFQGGLDSIVSQYSIG